MKRKTNQALLPIIASEYLEDKKSTIWSLSKKYDTSNKAIGAYFKNQGIAARKNFCQKLTEEQEKQMVIEYESGAKNNFLAKKYGICLVSVKNIVKKHGGKQKPKGGQKVYECNESYFEKIDSHEKAQILGLLYADGNICMAKRSGSSMWRLELQMRDECLIKQVASLVGYNGKLQYKILNNRKYAKLAVARKKMAKDLINLGCFENKTFSIRFPEFLDQQYWASFLYGYWLGDGWCSFSTNTNHTSFYFGIIGNNDFINYCKTFLDNELGVECCVSPHWRSEGVSDLRINGANCAKFWEFISKDIILKLDRKINKAEAIREYVKTKQITPELLKSQKNDLFFY